MRWSGCALNPLLSSRNMALTGLPQVPGGTHASASAELRLMRTGW